MMFRHFISVLFGLFVLIASVGVSVGQTTLPTLRPQATVGDDVVRLGDLVSGTGALAATPIFRSPAPGTTGRLAAQDVALAAYRAGVELVDFNGIETVGVERLANALQRAAIANLLAFEMARVTGEPLSNLKIENAELPISVRHDAGDASVSPQITDLQFDENRGRVTAMLVTRAADRLLTTRLIAAAVVEADTIVLADALSNGDLIKRADLTLRRLPRTTTIGAITDPEKIIGQQARRSMVAGSVLRSQDLQAPTLVLRNREVLILLKRGGLALTARGKAMEDGALGDMIEVMNVRSQKILQGTVQRDGTVLIGVSTRPLTVRQAAGRRAMMDALGTPDSPLRNNPTFSTTSSRSVAPLSFEGLRS
ncbi:MAG: flagellar basal body P-ring formation chaperone FlgA [Pseudomonadota bacterium]